MQDKENMDSLSQVLNHLREKGQDKEFVINAQGKVTLEGKVYDPQAVRIIKVYRFEGESNPDDEAVIYLMETQDGIIGYSLDGYGIYSNHLDDAYNHSIQEMPRGEEED